MRGLCRSRGFQYMDHVSLQDHNHKMDLPCISSGSYRVGDPLFGSYRLDHHVSGSCRVDSQWVIHSLAPTEWVIYSLAPTEWVKLCLCFN